MKPRVLFRSRAVAFRTSPPLLLSLALLLLLGCAQAKYIELYPYSSEVAVNFQTRAQIEEPIAKVPVPRDARVDELVKQFQAAGCTGENLSKEPVQNSPTPNIICTLPGTSSKTIVVGAHHVIANGTKGYFDAWTAVTLLPSLYASIAKQQHEHTYEFVAFSSNHLKGTASYEYLKRVPQRQDETVAMIWLDFIGLGRISAWTERTDPNLLADLISTGHALSVPVAGLNLHGVANFDAETGVKDLHDHSQAFRWFDIPTIFIHSFTESSVGLLTNRNFDSQMDRLDREAYFDSYRVLALYLGYLDRSLEARQL